MSISSRLPVVCGVDIGSTNIKAVLLSRDGDVVARVSRTTPRDDRGLSMEGGQLLDLIERMIVGACAERFEVHAVCVAGIGEDGVLVDSALRPLTPALAWFDPRRADILGELRKTIAFDNTFDASDDSGRTLVGWAWARAQHRSAPAVSWVAAADLPAVHWTRRLFLSDTLASRTGAWRAHDRSWAAERVLATLGSAELLPPVVPAGLVAGEVQSATLADAGVLAADAIAVVGGHDHPVGGWGVARMTPGAILDSMGTAEVIVGESTSPPDIRRDDIDRAPGIGHPGTTLLRVEEISRNVEWACRDREIDAIIGDLLAGHLTPEPVLQSDYFRPGRPGGGLPSYSPDTPRSPSVRAAAVLGALAHVGAESVSALRGTIGESASSRVFLAGGWARSPGWVAIKEAISQSRGAPIAEPIVEPEVTAVGASLIAAAGREWDIDPARALGY